MTTHRVGRGYRTQLLIAQYAQSRGWPFATPSGSGTQGVDVVNMPGLAPEVKARRGFRPIEWSKQAKRNANGDLPFVVMRPDGLGEQSIEDWLMFFRVGDGFPLLPGYMEPDGYRDDA